MNDDDQARVEPRVDCDEAFGSTAEQPPGEVTTARRTGDEYAWRVHRENMARICEVAHRLYRRFGKADEDVMELWSLVVVDPDQRLTPKDLARTQELARERGWLTDEEG